MIKDDTELENSKRWLETLRQELEQMKKEYTDPQEFDLFSKGAREHINQIESEIAEYVRATEPSATRH